MRFADATRHRLALVAVVSLIVGALSWSSAAQACTVTTTVSKPTNVAATVNEEGILFQWDAAPEADNVFNYVIDRGIGAGATLQYYGSIELVATYNTQTGTTTQPTGAPTDFTDYGDRLDTGETYSYAVTFERWDNCGGRQRSTRSDTASVTYEPAE